jgi:hypothetical protein
MCRHEHVQALRGGVALDECLDCSPLLDFGVFKELRDLSYFREVRVSGGTVVWPHEQDVCPDTLYLDSRKAIAETAQ